jgi:hypothetical protein
MSAKDRDNRAIHPKRRNKISGQWSARLIEMLESPAYRALSQSGHRVMSRIEIELARHGGNENGRLPVTTDDFVAYGMHRSSVAPAIREVEALGFIIITEKGRGGNAEHGSPNYFYLTFAHGRASKAAPPTHDWREIKTDHEAEQIAKAARDNKNPYAVAHGKRSYQKRRLKTFPGTETSTESVRKFRTESEESPVRKNRTTGSDQKTVLLSISRVGAAPEDAPLSLWTTPLLRELPWDEYWQEEYRREFEPDLREHAKKFGCRVRRRGNLYTITRPDGTAFGGESIASLRWWLDVEEHKPRIEVSTECGVPLYAIN